MLLPSDYVTLFQNNKNCNHNRQTNKYTKRKRASDNTKNSASQKSMAKTKKETPTTTNIALKIRTLIWNATIRAILTYGLQPKNLRKSQNKKLEHFTITCHRKIIEPNWITQLQEIKHISQEQVNKKMQQHIIQTWIQN